MYEIYNGPGMIQSVNENDTIVKQLNQAAEVKSSNTLLVKPSLIEPGAIRSLDSIAQSDSTATSGSAKKTIKTPHARSARQASFRLDSIKPIKPSNVDLITSKDSNIGIILPEKKIERDRPDWIIGVFILVLILLATVRLFFNKYLNQLFHAVINYATSFRLYRDRTLSLTHAAFRLDLIFYFMFSIFIYQFFDLFHVSFGQSNFITFLIILGTVVAYYILKRLVYFFTGILVDSSSETAEFLYNMHLYNRILGLLLIPVTLIIAFGNLSNPRWMVYLGLSVVGFLYLLLIIRGSKILMTKHFSIFYLILYLCTLEILPLIFIYNLVLVKNGIE